MMDQQWYCNMISSSLVLLQFALSRQARKDAAASAPAAVIGEAAVEAAGAAAGSKSADLGIDAENRRAVQAMSAEEVKSAPSTCANLCCTVRNGSVCNIAWPHIRTMISRPCISTYGGFVEFTSAPGVGNAGGGS